MQITDEPGRTVTSKNVFAVPVAKDPDESTAKPIAPKVPANRETILVGFFISCSFISQFAYSRADPLVNNVPLRQIVAEPKRLTGGVA